MIVSFKLDVTPKGKLSPKLGTINGQARAFKNPKTRELESTLRAMVSEYRPRTGDQPVTFDGPVQLVIVAVMPRAADLCALSKKPGNAPLRDTRARWDTRKPDCDNIAKGITDAMQDWWRDDSQVAVLLVVKRMAALGEAPHYSVQVSDLVEQGEPVCLRYEADDVDARILDLASLPF